MSNTGKQFTEADIPPRQRAKMGTAEKEAWCAAQTKRFQIVARCKETGRGYIAEEMQERILRTLPPNVRVLATMAMVQLTPDERCALIDAFDSFGNLLNPFDPA